MGLRREGTTAGARMDEDGCLRAEGMGMDQGLRSLGWWRTPVVPAPRAAYMERAVGMVATHA